MAARVSTKEIEAPAERRRRDAAALLCLEALEENMPATAIVKRFAEAGLLQHMPLTVDSHRHEQLTHMVASQGIVAARRIEAAMTRVAGAPATAPLSADREFQKYMALRLQLTEGGQLAEAFKRSDDDLLDSFAIFVEATAALFRLENDGADPIEAHQLSRDNLTSYLVTATKLREQARTALVHAAKEMERSGALISAYSGLDVVLRAQPTEAFVTDAWCDDDQEDRTQALLEPANDDDGVPNVWPPVLTKALFRVSTSSESRAAHLTVAAVRKSAAAAGSRVGTSAALVDGYAEAVEGLLSGRQEEVMPAASPRHREEARAKAARTTTLPRPVPTAVYDPIAVRQASEAETPLSPALVTAKQVRNFRGKTLDVPLERADMQAYVAKRREARLRSTGRGDLTVWSSEAFPSHSPSRAPRLGAHPAGLTSASQGPMVLSFQSLSMGSRAVQGPLTPPPGSSSSSNASAPGSPSSITGRPYLPDFAGGGGASHGAKLAALQAQLESITAEMQSLAGEPSLLSGPAPVILEEEAEDEEGGEGAGRPTPSPSPSPSPTTLRQDKLKLLAAQLVAVKSDLADAFASSTRVVLLGDASSASSGPLGSPFFLGPTGVGGRSGVGRANSSSSVITSATAATSASRRSSRMGPSTLLQEMGERVEATREALRTSARRLSVGDVPLSPTDLTKTRVKRAKEAALQAKGAQGASNSLASPVTRRLAAAHSTVVVPKDGGKRDSYLRQHDHADAQLEHKMLGGGGRDVTLAESTAHPSEMVEEGVAMGARLLSEAIHRDAENTAPVQRAPSPRRTRSPPKLPMAAAAVSAMRDEVLGDNRAFGVQVAGYVLSMQDVGGKASRMTFIPPNARPPTSGSMAGKGKTWDGVWAEGTALVDPEAATHARSVSPRRDNLAHDPLALAQPLSAGTQRPTLASPGGRTAARSPRPRATSPKDAARTLLRAEKQAAIAARLEAQHFHMTTKLVNAESNATHRHASAPGVQLLDEALYSAEAGTPLSTLGGHAHPHPPVHHHSSVGRAVQPASGTATPTSRSPRSGMPSTSSTPVHGASSSSTSALPAIPSGTPHAMFDLTSVARTDLEEEASQAASERDADAARARAAAKEPVAESPLPTLPTSEQGLLVEILPAYLLLMNSVAVAGPSSSIAHQLRKLLHFLGAYPCLPPTATAKLAKWAEAVSLLDGGDSVPSEFRAALMGELDNSYVTFKDAALARAEPQVGGGRGSKEAAAAAFAALAAEGGDEPASPVSDPGAGVGGGVTAVLSDDKDAMWAGQGQAGFVSPRRTVIAKLRKNKGGAGKTQAGGGGGGGRGAGESPSVVKPVPQRATPASAGPATTTAAPTPPVEYLTGGWDDAEGSSGGVAAPSLRGSGESESGGGVATDLSAKLAGASVPATPSRAAGTPTRARGAGGSSAATASRASTATPTATGGHKAGGGRAVSGRASAGLSTPGGSTRSLGSVGGGGERFPSRGGVGGAGAEDRPFSLLHEDPLTHLEQLAAMPLEP